MSLDWWNIPNSAIDQVSNQEAADAWWDIQMKDLGDQLRAHQETLQRQQEEAARQAAEEAARQAAQVAAATPPVSQTRPILQRGGTSAITGQPINDMQASPLQDMGAALIRGTQDVNSAIGQAAKEAPRALGALVSEGLRGAQYPLDVVSGYSTGVINQLNPEGDQLSDWSPQGAERFLQEQRAKGAATLPLGDLVGFMGPGEVKAGISAVRSAAPKIGTAAIDALKTANRVVTSPGAQGALGRLSPGLGIKDVGEAAPQAQRLYHGTRAPFDVPDASKFKPDGLYGPGYYLTSDPRVASSYAIEGTNIVPRYQQLADEAAAAGEQELARTWRGLLKDAEERLGVSAANVRAVDVPANLNLFDIGRPNITQAEIDRIASALPQGRRQAFSILTNNRRWQTKAQTVTGEDVYGQLADTVNSKAHANDVLRQAGFDGLKYPGGRHMPLVDKQGQAIEHAAVVVFPESLPKIKNAISGLPLGSAPQAGGALVGGYTGNELTPEDASTQERMRNILLGAGGGALAGHAVTRPGQLVAGAKAVDRAVTSPEVQAALRRVTPGGTLEDVSKAIPGAIRATGKESAAIGDVAKLAEQTLNRAKGTAEQAAQLRPAKPGFAGNIKLSKFDEAGVSDVIRQTVSNPEWNQFAGQRRGVITDAQAMKKAADKALGTSVEDWLKTKPGKGFNQEEALALGQTLAKTGQDYDGLLKTIDDARKLGTITPVMEAQLADKALEFGALAAVRSGSAAEAGRALRSFRAALSGEGASRTNAINAAFKELGGTEQFAKWVEEFSKIPADDAIARQMMLQSLYKSTLWEKLNAWRYASMLSSWKTHEVNFVSNMGQAFMRPVTTALAGHPRAAAADVYGMIRGIPEAWAAAGDSLKTGVSKFGVNQIENNIRPRPLGYGKLARAVALPTDMLGAADELWKSINYSGSLHSQAFLLGKGNVAKAERLLAKPSEAMVAKAVQDAKIATYQNDPGKLISAFVRFTNTPGPFSTAVKLVMPFIRTPANIYTRGLGLVIQPLAGPIKMAVAAAKGDTAVLRNEWAKTVIAGSTLAGLYGMAQSGALTGQGPSDPTKRRILEESGWQANSINIAGRWISYNNLGPLSVPMAAVAAVKEGLNEGKPASPELLADMADRLYNTMLDASFLSGVSSLFRAQSIASWGVQNATSIMGSFVPMGSGLAATERIIDPTMRVKDNPLQGVQGRIPGVSALLPADPSIYGTTRMTGPNDLAAQMFLPWQTSMPRSDPVAQEVARLTLAGQSTGVRQFSEDYAGAQQTPDQKRLLQGTAGKMAAAYIADTISKPSYQQLPDAQKANTISNMLGTAYSLADLKLGDQLARDPRRQALLAWANVPQYVGVKGSATEIREQNFAVAQAKAKQTEYRQKYKDQYLGDARLLKDDKAAYLLAQRDRLDSAYLKILRDRIDKQFGGALTQAQNQGLLGAGNTLLPMGAQ